MQSLLQRLIFLPALLLLPLFIIPQLQAQITQTVRGTVLDRQSESPLIGATIALITPAGSPALGAVSDENGRFTLANVPVGRQAFRITYLGYSEQNIPNVLVNAGRETVLDIRLEESLNAMKEVVVSAKVDKDKPVNELATVSARQFNLEEVMRYSGGRNDVAKLVANFAGVAANNDGRNDIIIRGNSPTGVLWRMEGIPIPNPNHFATLGTTGGPVSALNTNLIANSDFLTGAFPAEYGNALAGVFDINLRTGNQERYEGTFQIGAFSGLEAMVEGPMLKKNNGSFVAAYRHSFVELADAAGLEFGTSAVPRYKDLSFNFDFGNTKAGKFSLFGIAANSNIDFIGAELDSTDLWAETGENAYNTSRFGVLGIKHNLLLNDHSYLRTVVSGSYTGVTYEEDDISNAEPFRQVEVEDKLAVLRLSSFYQNKISARFTLRAGILAQQQGLQTSVRVRENTQDWDGDGVRDWVTQRDFDGIVNLLETYAQGQYRLNEQLTLNAGLHAMYSPRADEKSNWSDGKWAVEPRAALNWQFAPRHRFNVGYGLHNQTQPLPVYFYRTRLSDGSFVPSNQNLGFTSNHHLVLGYAFKPDNYWRIKVEAYYQWINNAPIDPYASSFSLLNAGADFIFPERGNLVNEGTGANRGVELTLEKFFNKGWYALSTISVFKSTYEGSDGVERSTAFDGRYVANFLAGKEFKIGSSGRRTLTLDSKLTAAGGRPYTPVNLDASRAAGQEVLYEDRAFSERMDSYFRWDVKFGFRLNSPKRKLAQTFFLDFQNVTNHENIFAMRYNTEAGAVGRVNQIGFFPDILYRVEF
ncbi:MAG: TonB-dependent receptor [Chitinophagales bacterium]|nr:TonB-dependent receptor [Chitinophagales bacterium]